MGTKDEEVKEESKGCTEGGKMEEEAGKRIREAGRKGKNIEKIWKRRWTGGGKEKYDWKRTEGKERENCKKSERKHA